MKNLSNHIVLIENLNTPKIAGCNAVRICPCQAFNHVLHDWPGPGSHAGYGGHPIHKTPASLFWMISGFGLLSNFSDDGWSMAGTCPKDQTGNKLTGVLPGRQ